MESHAFFHRSICANGLGTDS